MKLSLQTINALNQIWEQIGPDVLSCGIDGKVESVSRDEVIEMVLDAGRPQTFFPDVDWLEFFELPYIERVKLCKEQVFTYENYGW